MSAINYQPSNHTNSSTGKVLDWWNNRYNSPRWQFSRQKVPRRMLIAASILLTISGMVTSAMPFLVELAFEIPITIAFIVVSYAMLQSTRGVVPRRAKFLDDTQRAVRARAHGLSYRVTTNVLAFMLLFHIGNYGVVFGIAVLQVAFVTAMCSALFNLPDEGEAQIINLGRHAA